jgi:hypothetical protein
VLKKKWDKLPVMQANVTSNNRETSDTSHVTATVSAGIQRDLVDPQDVMDHLDLVDAQETLHLDNSQDRSDVEMDTIGIVTLRKKPIRRATGRSTVRTTKMLILNTILRHHHIASHCDEKKNGIPDEIFFQIHFFC